MNHPQGWKRGLQSTIRWQWAPQPKPCVCSLVFRHPKARWADAASSALPSEPRGSHPAALPTLSVCMCVCVWLLSPLPTAIDLLYWRDIKQTGIVFGSFLLLLFSLTQFSVVSVVAYLALAALSATISFRIYKSVLQAVQKTDEGHPFKWVSQLDQPWPASHGTPPPGLGVSSWAFGGCVTGNWQTSQSLLNALAFNTWYF